MQRLYLKKCVAYTTQTISVVIYKKNFKKSLIYKNYIDKVDGKFFLLVFKLINHFYAQFRSAIQ